MDDQIYERVIAKEGTREFTLLVDPAGTPHFSIEEATGKLDAPKAALMGVLVDGVLTQRLPWSLILIGAIISIVLEIVGRQCAAGRGRYLSPDFDVSNDLHWRPDSVTCYTGSESHEVTKVSPKRRRARECS
jgi:hypothetical protein